MYVKAVAPLYVNMNSFENPLSLAYLPTLPSLITDEPLILPALTVLSCPSLSELTFSFPPHVVRNNQIIQNCTAILNRIDAIVREKQLYLHSCLILQAGAQASMRLAHLHPLPRDWNTSVEMPFCLRLIKVNNTTPTTNIVHKIELQVGKCPRELDAEYLNLNEEWLYILFEILQPLKNMHSKQIPVIIPIHTTTKQIKVLFFS
uniref:Uncharacterized protein n=1 Tax=Heterorhabditis bacteriophora TaxID=37862 RepID=A0A1I7WMH1_HETBA